MAEYFFLLDGVLFAEQMRPALAASWRERSFQPCRALCAALLTRVEEFDQAHHISEGQSLVGRVVEGLRYERAFWRTLAGELIFYAAAEIPEFQTCPETLCALAGPDNSFMRQAHLGSKPLTFGAAVYRPEQCGLNDRDDVRRLAEYLGGLNPVGWQASRLSNLPEEERQEELAVARDWIVPLREMYRRAAEAGQVIVHEIL